MNGKLLLLLKVQLKDFLLPSRTERAQETIRGRRRSGAGYGVTLVVAAFVTVFGVSTFFMGFAVGLSAAGAPMDMLIVLAAAAASLFSMFTTIYKTNGLLFGFRDYELVMSLPFRASTIVACRVLILYVYNLFFVALFMIPPGVIYTFFVGGTGAWYWSSLIVGTLFAPVIPSIIGTAVGVLITLATSRFERRGIAGIVLTFAVMALWMLFVSNMDWIVESIAVVGPAVTATLRSIYPPAIWLAEGCCAGNIAEYVLFLVVSAALFAVFVFVVGRYFRAINSKLAGRRLRRDFQLGTLQSAAPMKALVRKEWKTLIGSSQYFLNTCMGYVVGIVMAVIMCVTMSAYTEAADALSLEFPEMNLAFLMPVAGALFLSLFLIISEQTAVNISVEGKQLGILKTLPVPAETILKAKRRVALVMSLSTALVFGVALNIAFTDATFPGRVLSFLFPIEYALLSVCYGQWLNLRYPKFDWTSLVKLVKQGKPVTIMTLTGLALVFGPILLIALCGEWAAYVCAAALGIWLGCLYTSLRRKGPAMFRELSA